ncbi:MAG: hypothetical protein N2688_00070 [Burkholderiaceae bacterium]|nr:hypothetical protein [Burkholderiaceae bacterium]
MTRMAAAARPDNGRTAALEAQAQAFNALLAYAEASDPRAVVAFGALCEGAAFTTPNARAAELLRLASRRMLAAAGEARR